MEYETAGDPISGLKWTRKTTEKIAKELRRFGIRVCRNTVGKLLKQMGFSLRVNHKKIPNGSPTNRDRQIRYIKKMRKRFERKGDPIVSVDTKKKELIGNFKNPGTTWAKEPTLVNDHDFPSLATGKGIPYGVYDLRANRGFVGLGVSRDTPEFASDVLEKWWTEVGRRRYPKAQKLLILADSGGSNAATFRVWKWRLQRLCDRYRFSITVCHYPASASKWNPIDHRLFCHITRNFQGRPLDSYETMLKYIRTTTTSTGLKVRAYLNKREYKKGVTVSEEEMRHLRLKRHDVLPKWNYTLKPRKNRK